MELPEGAREHILVVQDESIFHVNDRSRSVYLAEGQAILRQKGNGRAIHVSDFLDERSPTGRLCLSEQQLAEHDNLPETSRLTCTDAQKIIYPGKNSDAWWDMKQLLQQVENAVKIFEYLHPGAVGVFAFDCSSAHEAMAENALNVNNMNVKPGGKKARLRDTIIPINNPPPQCTKIADTRGQLQRMNFPDDHPDPKLRGQPKGMMQVLMERESVWEILTAGGQRKPVGTCKKCQLSQKKRDALLRVERAEDSGQDKNVSNEDHRDAEQVEEPERNSSDENNWCCMKRVLSLQTDFAEEKPYLQQRIEELGHRCIFLPKFHCELNAIEMYWGFAKSSESSYMLIDLNEHSSVYKGIGTSMMANSLLLRSWYLNVLICAIQ